MKRLLVVVLLVLAVPCLAVGQGQKLQPHKLRPEVQQGQDQKAERLAVAQQIIRAREQAGQRGAFDPQTVRYWTDRLARLSLNQLLEISAAGPDANLNEMVTARGGQVLSDNVSPDLGDTSADLVFTKVLPCRVADTRKPGAGGPLPRASTRDFQISGSNPGYFTPQGGVPCGIPYPGATAVAVNITVTGSTQPGWLRAWPYGSSGTASIINFSAGQTVANGLILPVCDEATNACPIDITVAADSGGTHLLIDVMGYFQKVDTEEVLSFTVSDTEDGTVWLPEAGACANYFTMSITVPGPGQIVARGKIQARVNHSTGTLSWMRIGISPSNGATCADDGFIGGNAAMFYIPPELPTTTFFPEDTAVRVFEAPSAGTYTFFMNGQKLSGAAGSQAMWFAGMTLTYSPH